MSFQLFTWILTVVALAATILVIKKMWVGWLLWGITDIGWIWVNWEKGLPAEAALFLAYLALTIWAIWEWRRRGKGIKS